MMRALAAIKSDRHRRRPAAHAMRRRGVRKRSAPAAFPPVKKTGRTADRHPSHGTPAPAIKCPSKATKMTFGRGGTWAAVNISPD